MIKVNEVEIEIKHFPDGSQLLNNCDVDLFKDNSEDYKILWRYESDEELVTLIYLVNHIRNKYLNANITLSMPYIPNARMDRTKNPDEVFTLKYFAKVINDLNFNNVYVLDAHSDVSLALLNNIIQIDVNKYIGDVVADIKATTGVTDDKFFIYFPDNGAYKRYKDLLSIKGFRKIYGQKIRDWKTGKITDLTIVNENNEVIKEKKNNIAPFKDSVILMIDDIISYGGTLFYSSLKLNKLGCMNIFAYATHVEPKSIWDKERGTFQQALGNNVVSMLYTTNSIYNLKSNSKVLVLGINI